MAESQILHILQSNNKPFGLQSLVDLLAHTGLKKAQIQKGLDALAASGKVVAKEFGKTKIFIPAQSDLSVLSKEELDAKRLRIKELGEELQQEHAQVKALEQELATWKSSLTEEEMVEQVTLSKQQLAAKQVRLAQLKGGAVLVSQVDRDAAVKELMRAMDGWKKRKAMFRNIWSALSEGVEAPQQEVFEEMGVETDEAVGCDFKRAELLLPSAGAGGLSHKRPRVALPTKT